MLLRSVDLIITRRVSFEVALLQARSAKRQRVNHCMDFRLTRLRFGLVLNASRFWVFNGYFQIESEFSGKVCNFKTRERGITRTI